MVLAQIWFKLVAKTIVDTFYDTSYTDEYFHYCISNTIVSSLIIRRVRTQKTKSKQSGDSRGNPKVGIGQPQRQPCSMQLTSAYRYLSLTHYDTLCKIRSRTFGYIFAIILDKFGIIVLRIYAATRYGSISFIKIKVATTIPS